MLQMAMVASSVVAADEGVLRLRSVRLLPAAEGPATPAKEADDRAGQETGPTGGLREERWLQSGRTEKAAGGVADRRRAQERKEVGGGGIDSRVACEGVRAKTKLGKVCSADRRSCSRETYGGGISDIVGHCVLLPAVEKNYIFLFLYIVTSSISI